MGTRKKTERPDLTTMGGRVLDAREAKGWTQPQLAEKSGIGQGTISDIENNKHGTAYAPELAAALDVEALWLKTGEPPRHRPASENIDVKLLRNVLIGVDAGLKGHAATPERRAAFAAAAYKYMKRHPGAELTQATLMEILRDVTDLI